MNDNFDDFIASESVKRLKKYALDKLPEIVEKSLEGKILHVLTDKGETWRLPLPGNVAAALERSEFMTNNDLSLHVEFSTSMGEDEFLVFFQDGEFNEPVTHLTAIVLVALGATCNY